jgi:transposase-like protein
MDLTRAVYSRELKIRAMRALEESQTLSAVARQFQLSPKLLDRWRGEWRARGELAFPGNGQRGVGLPGIEAKSQIAELERKIGQLTMENDLLKKTLQYFRKHHSPQVVNGDAIFTGKSRKRTKKGTR